MGFDVVFKEQTANWNFVETGLFSVAAIVTVIFVAGAVGVAVFKFFVVVGVGTAIARGLDDRKNTTRGLGTGKNMALGLGDRKNIGLATLGFLAALAACFLIYHQLFNSMAFKMACAGWLLGLTQWYVDGRTLRTPEGVFCLFVVSANLVLCFLSF